MSRVRLLPAVSALLVLCLPAPAAGQSVRTFLRGEPSGAQVVPPTASAGTALAAVWVNPGDSSVSILGQFTGLGSNAAGGALRGPAPPGGTGPVIGMIPSSASTFGSFSGSFALTPTLLGQLKAGLLYVELRSVNFPAGELRGQILPYVPLLSLMTGAQAIPGNGTTGVGHAATFVHTAGTHVLYRSEWAGLSGLVSLRLRGPAPAGTAGLVIMNIASFLPATSLDTASFPLTPAQVAALKAGLLSIELTTTLFPNGEIRGQIKYLGNVTDFDADGTAEAAVFRGSGNTWFRMNPVTFAFSGQAFGLATDTRTPADFDGDGRTDLAVWRSGTFYVWESRTNTLRVQPFGAPGDDARISADFDGDGKADFAVYRPGAQSILYVLRSLDGAVAAYPFGTTGDLSVFGDYDGDRRNDVAVYRPSTGVYYVRRSLDGALAAQQWGTFATDWLTPGDYDGDGRWDFAVWRGKGGDGNWYIRQSATGTLRVQPFGIAGSVDSSVMADYDGDGKTDVAVVRAGGGVLTWYILQSYTSSLKGFVFGIQSDQAIQLYLRR